MRALSFRFVLGAAIVSLGLVGAASARPKPAAKAAKPSEAAASADSADVDQLFREVTLPPDEDVLSLDVSFETAGPPQALVTIGLQKTVSQEDVIASANKMNAFLKAELKGEVTTRLYNNATAIGEALSKGEIDAAWLTATAYVQAREHSEVTPVVRIIRKGFVAYRSVFIAKAGAKQKKLEDFKGMKMAWGARDSASSRIVPWSYLKRHAIDPLKFFSKNLDLSDHQAVCNAVKNGTADLGVTLANERPAGEALIADGCITAGVGAEPFMVIEKVGPIPNDVIATRAKLDPVIATRLSDAFTKMSATEEGKARLKEIFNAEGFSTVADADFAPFRTLRDAANR